MAVRGIRGATTAADNSRGAILEATAEMLRAIVETNGLNLEDIASAVFTTTADLNATFPALAARQIGWTGVPLLDCREMDVPGSLPLCIRVLLLVNTDKPQNAIHHTYLKGAVGLRDAVQRELS